MKLISVPANPVPDYAVAGTIKTPDGVTLRFARFLPPPGRRGTVVVLQGRGEFIEKYFETARDLRNRGFAMATFDWRGQGLSERALSNRNKSHVRSFADYAVDLAAIMEQVVLPDCPPPIFALCHSMGGAIGVAACHTGSRWFERVVLSAPMIALPRGQRLAAPLLRVMRLLGRGSAYVPAGGAASSMSSNFLGNKLTSDPVRFARNASVLEAEPDLAVGSPTISWADSALRLMKRFAEPAYAAEIRQPILLVAAGADEVVATAASETFGTNLLAGRHLILPGARHEILQEQDQYRNQFWAAFDAFVPGTPLF